MTSNLKLKSIGGMITYLLHFNLAEQTELLAEIFKTLLHLTPFPSIKVTDLC